MILPSVDEDLLDSTTGYLTSEGYEWNEYLRSMTQYEIDLDPEDYKTSCRLLHELREYVDYLYEWF